MRNILYIYSILLLHSCNNDEVKEIKPVFKQLSEAVYASGSLVPEEEYKIVSSVDGYLNEVLTTEGQIIKKGDLLFSLNNDWRNEQENSAKMIYNKTLPIVEQNSPLMNDLKYKIELIKLKLTNDSLNYIRSKNLFEQDIISASVYEKAKLQYDGSTKELKSLGAQMKQMLLQSEIQKQQAANQANILHSQNNLGNIRSYYNGVIYEIYKKPGDMIQPNQPIALMGNGKMIAKLLIDENDLHLVKIGQEVIISIDAFADKKYHAHITKIYPILNKVEQSFRLDAAFDEPLPQQIYGLNLEANIVIRKKESIMVIPRKALLSNNVVTTKVSGKRLNKVIEKGLEDAEYIEVKAGLTDNQTILLHP